MKSWNSHTNLQPWRHTINIDDDAKINDLKQMNDAVSKTTKRPIWQGWFVVLICFMIFLYILCFWRLSVLEHSLCPCVGFYFSLIHLHLHLHIPPKPLVCLHLTHHLQWRPCIKIFLSSITSHGGGMNFSGHLNSGITTCLQMKAEDLPLKRILIKEAKINILRRWFICTMRACFW